MKSDFEKFDLENIVSEYQQLRPTYEALTERTQSLIIELLGAADIKPQFIEHRTKTVKSFAEKIQREGKSYKNPLEDVTDLCGVRIILYTVEDLEKACKLLEEEFDVDRDKSGDKRKVLKPHEFGYLSVHYIVQLNNNRASLREYKNFVGKRVEIQVRTVLQHAWAAIDHRLRYKSNFDAPEHLRRRLFLLSGLFEMADREFSELVMNAEQYATHVEGKISENNLIIPIDSQSLSKYIMESETIRNMVQIAIKAGMKPFGYDNIDFEELSEHQKEITSDLAYYCFLNKINTLKELDYTLTSVSESKVEEYFISLVTKFDWSAPSYPMMVILFIWFAGAREPLTKDLLDRGWDQKLSSRMIKFLKTYRSTAR